MKVTGTKFGVSDGSRRVALSAAVLCSVLVAGDAVLVQRAGAEERLIKGFEAVRACSCDIGKLCSGIEPGGDRIKDCIKGKVNELSTGCKEALAVFIAAGETVNVTVGPLPGNRLVHLENARNYPFCEFGLVLGNSFETADAHVWNTTGASDCPPKYRDPIDAAGPEAFGKKHGALAGWLNPRRHWMFDEIWVYDVGETHDFDGVQATWMAKTSAKALLENANMTKGGGDPYRPATIYRLDTFKYKAGATVHILDAPDGGAWVMQSWTDHFNKDLTYDKLKDLGSMYKRLPPGWKFRTKVLDADLEVTPPPPERLAKVLLDEFHDVFEGCGYDAACTYKP
jgi:hypothetical protein